LECGKEWAPSCCRCDTSHASAVQLDARPFTPSSQQQAKLLRTKVSPRPLSLLFFLSFLSFLSFLFFLSFLSFLFFLSFLSFFTLFVCFSEAPLKHHIFLLFFSPNPNRCILHPPQELRPKKMERDAWDKACDQVSLMCDGRSTVHLQCFEVVVCDVRCTGSCEENSSSEMDGRWRGPFSGTTIRYSALFLGSAFFVYSSQVFLLFNFVL
jgi:hypothetical protein